MRLFRSIDAVERVEVKKSEYNKDYHIHLKDGEKILIREHTCYPAYTMAAPDYWYCTECGVPCPDPHHPDKHFYYHNNLYRRTAAEWIGLGDYDSAYEWLEEQGLRSLSECHDCGEKVYLLYDGLCYECDELFHDHEEDENEDEYDDEDDDEDD